MADGTTKPIDEIEVGDWVLATNPESGKDSVQRVTAVWIHDDSLIDLELEGGVSVTTTADHHFWNRTDHQWQTAEALDAGDQLYGIFEQHAAVVGLDHTTERIDVAYNLTVSRAHTYYVLAGTTPILVHNCGGPFAQRIDNISSHLTDRDLNAARRELNGEIVARKPDGTPWDHVSEVRDAQRGLINIIDRVQRQLGNPSLTQAERAALVMDLSRASRLLDHSESFVPRP
jgi:hypothetical protein